MNITELHDQPGVWIDDDTCTFLVEGEEYRVEFEILNEYSQVKFRRSSPKKSTNLALSALGKWGKSLVTNPFVLAIAASQAVSAVGKWKKQKKSDMYFMANSIREKKFYEKMVKDLVKGGKYKIIKSQPKGALSHEWLLRRK